MRSSNLQPIVPLNIVSDLMEGFAESTGIMREPEFSRRYLWTDAFGVCNFIGLYLQTGEAHYMKASHKKPRNKS